LPQPLQSIQWVDFVADAARGADEVGTALKTDLEWIREHTRLLVRAREWIAAERDNGPLLRGKDLVRAEAWFATSAGKQPAPAALHAELIATSRKRATTTQRRLVSALSIGLVVTITLAVVAVLQSNERERQRQIAVAKQVGASAVLVREQRGSGLTLSALLAVESTRRLIDLGDSSVEGAQALAAALQLLPRRVHWIEHPSNVTDVNVTGNGAWLVTAAGGMASIWDATSGELQNELEHPSQITGAVVDERARYLLARSNRDLSVWDVAARRRAVLPLSSRDDLYALSPSGSLFAITSEMGIEIYDPAQAESPLRRIDTGGVDAIRFLADDTLQVDRAEETIQWRAGESRPVRILRYEYPANVLRGEIETSGDGAKPVCDLALEVAGPAGAFRLGPRCEHLVTSDVRIVLQSSLNPTTLQIWERRVRGAGIEEEDAQVDYASIASLEFERGITALSFSADGARFVTASGDYRVQVWEARTGREAQRIEHAGTARAAVFGRPVDDTAASSGISLVATAGARHAGVWQLTANSIDRRASRPRMVTRGMAFSADGRRLAVSTTQFFELWDLPAGRLLRRDRQLSSRPRDATIPLFHPHPRTPQVAGDQQSLVVPGAEATIIYDRDGQPRSASSYGRTDVVALSPDGDLVAAADATLVQLIRLADDSRMTIEQEDVREMAISGGNRHLAASGGGALHVWRLGDDGAVEVDVNAPDDVRALAFSADGNFLAVGARSIVRVYDVRSPDNPQPVADFTPGPSGEVPMPHEESATLAQAVAFSPDSRLVAATWGNARFALWEVDGGRLLLDEPMESLQSLAFSPDSSTFAAFGRNQPVRVWNGLGGAKAHEVLRIPHRENVGALVFSPDGRLLASASSDDLIVVSPVELEDLLAEATTRLPRNLTAQEWSYYFGTEPYRCVVPELSDCIAASEAQRTLR
jgi:WD40 repeat protein